MLSVRKTASRQIFLVALVLLSVFVQPQLVEACATCGCSELCPLVMLDDTESSTKSKGLLTESIWGNIILKMAYQRDPVIRKLLGHQKDVDLMTATAFNSAVSGTLAQNIVSQATLNPPDGQFDSYLPGSLGLGFSSLVNVALDTSIVLRWGVRRKIRARQKEIRVKVEGILEHLEYSVAECPEAQRDLTGIIGDRAARECVQLWQSSHAVAAAPEGKGDLKESLDGSKELPKQISTQENAFLEGPLTMAPR